MSTSIKTDDQKQPAGHSSDRTSALLLIDRFLLTVSSGRDEFLNIDF